MKLVESIVTQSEKKIGSIKQELSNKLSMQEKALTFISFCLKNKEVLLAVIDLVKDIV